MPRKTKEPEVTEEKAVPATYELCDICHKAKPRKEIEKLVVVYRRCKHCSEMETEIQKFEFSPAVKEVTPIRRRPVRQMMPPGVGEVFAMPPELRSEAVGQAQKRIPAVFKHDEQPIAPERPAPADGNNAPAAEGNAKGENS